MNEVLTFIGQQESEQIAYGIYDVPMTGRPRNTREQWERYGLARVSEVAPSGDSRADYGSVQA